MIVFKKLRYKNFLSSGNLFTEMDFEKHQLTLIVGRNGAGKSTAIDALTFCLYNKTIRNINKPQLVNAQTGRDLVAEVEFAKGKNQYLVRRGIKPAVFEIFCNGKMIDQPSDLKDYQEQLEVHILQINFKAFCQIVVLGSKNYVPFLSLTAQARRDIVEDLLDIQIFSTMNSLLKDKLSAEKELFTAHEYEVKGIQNEISLYEEFQAKLRRNKEEIRKEKEDAIARLETEKALTETALRSATASVEVMEARLGVAMRHDELYNKVSDAITKNDARVKKIKKQIADYSQKECPTCKRPMEAHSHADKIKELETALETASKKIEFGFAKLEEIKKLDGYLGLVERRELTDEISNQKQSVWQMSGEIAVRNKAIGRLRQELDAKEETAPEYDIQALQTKLAEANKKIANSREQIGIMNVTLNLLKDGGIKAHVIKQYIPIMNKLINQYLEKFDFFLAFNFNENFIETIGSRYRESFSYESFSEGEKFRINLAILFAWREIAKIRNSSATNLLIMDEIFDSSLDIDGTDDFMRVISELGKDNNVFVISHKVDSIIDKFQNVIKVGKNKSGFSEVVSEA